MYATLISLLALQTFGGPVGPRGDAGPPTAAQMGDGSQVGAVAFMPTVMVAVLNDSAADVVVEAPMIGRRVVVRAGDGGEIEAPAGFAMLLVSVGDRPARGLSAQTGGASAVVMVDRAGAAVFTTLDP